jgi:hypothetical protein
MLPSVRNRFFEAYKLAEKAMPKGAFIQVWNLFYLCDKNLRGALKTVCKINSRVVCSTETGVLPRIVWFAWGGDDKNLNAFKARFLDRQFTHAFFFDKFNNKVCARSPTRTSFAKHPQGLRAQPIVEHLANIL